VRAASPEPVISGTRPLEPVQTFLDVVWSCRLHDRDNETKGNGKVQQIEVQKSALVEQLTANRAKHRAVFEKAIEGYRKEATKQLDALVTELKAGRAPKIRVILPLPVDHTRDYDRVLKMLDLHIHDTYRLDEADVARYIEDDWDWKREFIRTSSAYAADFVEANYPVSDPDEW
jgi:hypothetical protein